MKKLKLVPLALAATTFAGLASAQSASSVQLYGNLTASVTTQDHQSTSGATTGGSMTKVGNDQFSISYLGFRGKEALGDGMSGIFDLEMGITTNNGGQAQPQPSASTKLFNRQSWVGLDVGPYGQVTVGRQFSAGVDLVVRALDIYNAASSNLLTTPIGTFGVNRFASSGLLNGSNATGNAAFDNRADSSVKYRLNLPDSGLKFGASFGFNDGGGRNYSLEFSQGNKDYQVGGLWMRYESPMQFHGYTPKQDTYMFGGNVNVGAFNFMLTFLDNRLDAGSASPLDNSFAALPAAAQTALSNATLAALANGIKQEDKVWQLAAKWHILPNLDWVVVGYFDQGTNIDNVAGRNGNKDTYVTSLDYFFSRSTDVDFGLFNTKLKSGYTLDQWNQYLLSGGNYQSTATSYTGVTIGLRHRF